MADTPYEPMPFGDDSRSIVYIREAKPDEIPADAEIEGPVYAVHDATGRRLALAADRNLAFALARQNDLTPMSVH